MNISFNTLQGIFYEETSAGIAGITTATFFGLPPFSPFARTAMDFASDFTNPPSPDRRPGQTAILGAQVPASIKSPAPRHLNTPPPPPTTPRQRAATIDPCPKSAKLGVIANPAPIMQIAR